MSRRIVFKNWLDMCMKNNIHILLSVVIPKSNSVFPPTNNQGLCFSPEQGVFQSRRNFPRKGFPNNKKIFSKKSYLTKFQEY